MITWRGERGEREERGGGRRGGRMPLTSASPSTVARRSLCWSMRDISLSLSFTLSARVVSSPSACWRGEWSGWEGEVCLRRSLMNRT